MAQIMIPTPDDFELSSAVCSHGFFVLAPNRWNGERSELHTTLPIDDQCVAAAAISADGANVCVNVPGCSKRSIESNQPMIASVRRILRLDEDLGPFQRLCAASDTHRAAARCRFGRLLRSASLFEDVVKIICTCNVTWRQTTSMVAALVRHFGAPAINDANARGFPGPESLARVSSEALKAAARVGYRATSISRLARGVTEGTIDLAELEDPNLPTKELARRLKALPGVGPYSAASLGMLLGRYDRLAVDTEMRRFWKQHYPRRRQTVEAIERHYRPWQPYAFLAYWWELWRGYAETHGEPEQWETSGQGRQITTPKRKRSG